ncbi:MAG: hypothetical protein IJP88_06515, partial [Synergistaceae bacterium]|nr:hypothetical protein [Synergistaceae bacterium]
MTIVSWRNFNPGSGTATYGTINKFIAAGEEASCEIIFGTPIQPWLFYLTFETYGEANKNSPVLYQWVYDWGATMTDQSEKFIEHTATFNASIKAGKTDYTYIDKACVGLGVAWTHHIFEAKYLTNQNKFVLPAGKYSVTYSKGGSEPVTQKEIESTAANPVTFASNPLSGFGDTYIEYGLYDLDTSSAVSVLDDRGDTLSGKTITIEYPNEDAVIVKSKTLPDYDKRQFEYLPYFELISDDEGYVTSVKYTVINSDDTTPPFTRANTHFKISIQLHFANGDEWIPNDGTGNIVTEETTVNLNGKYKYEDFYHAFVAFRIFENDEYTQDIAMGGNSDNPTLTTFWNFSNELPGGMVIQTELNDDVLTNVVTFLASEDLEAAPEEFSEIDINSLGEKAHVTEAAENYAEDVSADIAGRLNTITVEEDGWYLMQVKTSSELSETLQETSADNLMILPVTDEELTDYESEGYADVSRTSAFKSAKVSRKVRKADDESSSSTNKAKILSLSGGKLDNTSSNEFLIAGNFKAGQTVNMYLAKAKTSSASPEPEKPNASEIK